MVQSAVDNVLLLVFMFGGLLGLYAVSYTHLRAHETPEHLVCRLLLEKKQTTISPQLSSFQMIHCLSKPIS